MAVAALGSYAALGDSFTVGVGCPPGAAWADRLAEALRRRSPDLVYRNFAEDGATSAEVIGQLDPALELEPDFVTLICGVNDVLQSVRPDPSAYGARFDQMLGRLEAAKVPVVVTATAPENLGFLALGPRTARRVRSGLQRINEETRRHAEAHGITCIEVAGHPGLDDPENFQEDGLHPSPLGHARAAAIFERMLDEGTLSRNGRGPA